MTSIDVVIPNYRYGRYLAECIDSVRAQGIDNLRILVVDNASDDDSVAITRAMMAGEPRLHLLARDHNMGPHASFNSGIDWAEADYMLILCADDLLPPGALDRALTALERHPSASLALGLEAAWWDGQQMPSLDRTPEQRGWRIEEGSEFIRASCRRPSALPSAGAVIVRTAAQKRVGHYRSALRYNDDFEMLLRLATTGSIARTEDFLGIRREHDCNMSRDFWRRRIDALSELEAAFSSFFTHEGAALPDAERLLRTARARLGDAAWWAAVSHLVKGRQGDAMELFKYAYVRSPTTRWLPPLAHLWRTPGVAYHIVRILRETAPDAR